MFIISGDSHIRQVFARLIHAIRSRECDDVNEQFRGGVFERYFHLSAGYVVTTRGDALLLDWADCERVASEPVRSSAVPGRVLLRICYVWDNTNDASASNFGTEYAIQRVAQLTKIAAVIFSPTMHHCNYAGGKCQSANMSNGAVMTVVAQALKHDIPRVVVTTTIMRHWYPHYATDMISERNDQLRSFFSLDISDMLLLGEHERSKSRLLFPWRRRRRATSKKSSSDNDGGGNNNNNNGGDHQRRHEEEEKEEVGKKRPPPHPEPVERTLYWALNTPSAASSLATTTGRKSRGGGVGLRYRMYDYAIRQTDLTPRQCDHGHSMCMFFPLRTHPKTKFPVNGMSGVCPNGSRCEDPWNFLMMQELLSLLLA